MGTSWDRHFSSVNGAFWWEYRRIPFPTGYWHFPVLDLTRFHTQWCIYDVTVLCALRVIIYTYNYGRQLLIQALMAIKSLKLAHWWLTLSNITSNVITYPYPIKHKHNNHGSRSKTRWFHKSAFRSWGCLCPIMAGVYILLETSWSYSCN